MNLKYTLIRNILLRCQISTLKLESGSDKFNSGAFSVATEEPANKPGKYQGKCEICISRVGAVQPNIAAPPNSNIDMLLAIHKTGLI